MIRFSFALGVFLLPFWARGESLAEAYKLARQSDPKFKAAQAEYRANGTVIDQARAGFLPTAKFDVDKIETRQRIVSSNNPIFGAGGTNFPTENHTWSTSQASCR